MNDYKNLKVAYLKDTGYMKMKENFSGYIPKRLVQKITAQGKEIDINDPNTYNGKSAAAETFNFILEFTSSGDDCPVIERNYLEWGSWGKNYNYNGEFLQVSRCNDSTTTNKCYVPEDTYYDSKGVKCKQAGARWDIVATKKSNDNPCTIQFALNYFQVDDIDSNKNKIPVIDDLKYNSIYNKNYENALFHKYVYPSIPKISLQTNNIKISSNLLEMIPILDSTGTNKYNSTSYRYDNCLNTANNNGVVLQNRVYGIAKDGSIGCGVKPYHGGDGGYKIATNCYPANVRLGGPCPYPNQNNVTYLSDTKKEYNNKQFFSLSVPIDHPLCKYLKLTTYS